MQVAVPCLGWPLSTIWIPSPVSFARALKVFAVLNAVATSSSRAISAAVAVELPTPTLTVAVSSAPSALLAV
jgi:hypothetical protein